MKTLRHRLKSDSRGSRRDAVNQVAAELPGIAASIAAIRTAQDEIRQEVRDTRHHLMLIGQLALGDEAETRRRLYAAREGEDYERAYREPVPLVSICIPTYTNYRGLVDRAIPSALSQDHPATEVVVVGDASPPETEEAIRALADPRVRFENLAVRGPYPEDERSLWYVAGTTPLNRAMHLARGQWIAILNDDDAMRPDHVSSLLAAARESGAEVAYGRLERHAPDGSRQLICDFPPASHAFGWQAALQHGALRLFEYELAAWLFNEPGDWHRARRMLRAGVRFQMIDQVVGDYYPSRLWRDD